jgi:TonB-linked SusC/RagA family outer membrane protein
MKKLLFLQCALVLLTGLSYGQSVVKGTVRDETGPVPGATVRQKGSTEGTITNTDGTFSLAVQDLKAATLTVSYVGMEEAEYKLDGKATGVDILMRATAAELDEMVVVGYGTQRRGDLTGAVVSISSKAIEKVPVTSVGQALAGRMAGVQITATDGSPDPEILVRVRGGGSITQDNSPLYIVDGFQMGGLNAVPPTDIQSIDILKDAAATAIYGARGANGVVIITTKSGKKGKTTVSLNSYFQAAKLARKLDLMNPYEFVMFQYERELMETSTPVNIPKNFGDPRDYYLYKNEKGHDWQDDILGKKTVSQVHNASISGGGDKSVYNFSLTNSKNPGQLVGSGYGRTNLNFKLLLNLHKNVKLEYNTRYQKSVNDGTGTSGVNVLNALEYRPTMGLGDFTYVPAGDEVYDEELEKYQLYKPSEEANQNWRKRIATSFVTSAALTWQIAKPLSFRTELAYTESVNKDDSFFGPLSGKANNIGNNGMPITENTRSMSSNYIFRNIFTYDTHLHKDGSLSATLGQEMIGDKSSSNFSSARFFPKDITYEKALANVQLGTPFSNSSYMSGMKYNVSAFSFFGRVNYDFMKKYFATLTLRSDGSHIFAPGKRWGLFPAAAVAWRVSDEAFLKNSSVVSNLKFRLSYGAAGNNRINPNLWRKTYSINSYDTYGFLEQLNSFYYQSSKYLPNPDLKWETTLSRNLGIDFGLFKERIHGTFDTYWNTTKDLLVPSKIPNTSGFEEQQTNIGQTSNRGVELTLNGYVIEKRDFTLDLNFNIGYNKSRIDKLASGEDIWYMESGISGELISLDDYRLQVGKTMGLIMGYVNDGFYSVDDFTYDDAGRSTLKPGIVDSRLLSGTPRPGNAKFKKLTPVDSDDPNTYIITNEDRQIIGDTNPKFSGGFGLNAAWKGFDLTTFFNFMYGFDVYNVNKIHLTSNWRNSLHNLSAEMNMDKRFRYVDDEGNNLLRNPEALRELNKNATIWSPLSMTKPVVMTSIIEDGSFFRLNTISLGYTIPRHISQKVGMSRLRFYATGYNLWLLTKYSGYDPEVNVQRGLFPGMDNNNYPRNKSLTMGVNITF